MMLFQFTDCGQAVNGISCEPAHTFCDDKIEASGKSICDHLFEPLTLCRGTAAQTLVSIYPDKFPVIMFLNVVRIIADLCFIRCELFF